MNHP